MKPLSFQRTRIAPTPSGFLHKGNALNFLLVQALAKQSGASILLRIDDGDRERYRPAYAQNIFDTLHLLGIDWQEGPKNVKDLEEQWSQRHRMALYEQALRILAEKEAVFACTCSRTEAVTCRCEDKNISLRTPNAAWRLRTSEDLLTVKEWNSITQTTLSAEMKNFVVRKRDGLPAYQLCSVVDDVHFGIDLIVRGEDLWPSTLAQLYLAKVLGLSSFLAVTFVHHPLLTNDDGEKLSKSVGNAAALAFFDVPALREAALDLTLQLLQT
jgi:glutamyl-Q tRNA(Asp) synthetase